MALNAEVLTSYKKIDEAYIDELLKKEIEKNMHKAAAELNFEEAAALRDKMIEINQYLYENKKRIIKRSLS